MNPDEENQPNLEEMEQLINENPIVHSIAVSLGNIHLLSPTAQDVFCQELIEHYNAQVEVNQCRVVITETLRHDDNEIDLELWELTIRLIGNQGIYSENYLTYTHIVGSPVRDKYQYMF